MLRLQSLQRMGYLLALSLLAMITAGCATRQGPSPATPHPSSTPTAAFVATAPHGWSPTATFPLPLPTAAALPRLSTITRPTQAGAAGRLAPPPTPQQRPSPTPTATLSSAARFLPHPLALDQRNTGAGMQRLARFGKGMANDLAWSPDGKVLAVATGLGVFLYDAATLEKTRFIDMGGEVNWIAFHPDGQQLAVAQGTRASVWQIADGQKLAQMRGEIGGGIWELAYGRGGQLAAIGQAARGLGDPTAQLKVWSAATGRLILSQTGYGWVVGLDIREDGGALAFGGDDPVLLDLRTRQGIDGFHFLSLDVMFSPDGAKLYTTPSLEEEGPGLRVWDLANGAVRTAFVEPPCSYLSRNGSAAICYNETTVVVFDPLSGQVLKALEVSNSLESATVSPDGESLAFIEQDTVRVWDLETEQQVKVLEFDDFRSFAAGLVDLNGAERYLAATSANEGRIKVWDLASGEVIRTLQASEEEVSGLAFRPDRRVLASIDFRGWLRLWDIQEGVQVRIFNLKDASHGPLVFSPDGSRLAMLDRDQEMILELDLQTGELGEHGPNFSAHASVSTLAYPPFDYSPDGHLLTWKYERYEESSWRVLVIIDWTTDSVLELPYHVEVDPDFIEAIAFSADGNYLAAGNAEGEISVWELRSRTLRQVLTGHEERGGDGWSGSIRHLRFSPQTDLLVSIGWDGTTRLWNIHSGLPVRLLQVCCLADFSPDGRLLLTAGEGVIRAWGIPPWP